MSFNSMHKCLIDNRLWAFVSVVLIGWYLSPLFYHTFYIPTFDNLDSNIVWFKILAHSGMIFAPSDAIIPNMMNGLPRSSYGSEFNVILWLYYFFSPKTAYIINEVLIHLIAFFSMFVFLKAYIVKPNRYYGLVPLYFGALYFALLPFWSGAGASIPLLPLVTYTLLNIKLKRDTKWDWILLILLPLYTSFVFLYMFYIILAGIYIAYDTIKQRSLDVRLFGAVFLMGTMFLLSEYRLVYTMFFDSGFVSHRTEFDIFFQENLWETYRLALVNFLQGHVPHAQSFQQALILPLSLAALALMFKKDRFTKNESLVIWAMVLTSFYANFWDIVLIHKFTLPGIALFSIAVYLIRPRYRLLPLLLMLIIVLSSIAACFEYKGLHWLVDIFPIFKALNMIRMIFIEPFVYTTILVLALLIYFRKLHFTIWMLWLFVPIMFVYSMHHSFYQTAPKEGYASFESYYAPKTFDRLFEKVKQIDKNFDKNTSRFVSFGMEPAISLFNGLHTVDGYSTNYPLSYKYAFRKVFAPFQKNRLYDIWGSKVYIASILTDQKYYQKGLKITKLRFDTKALCNLGTNYILSPYRFGDPNYEQSVQEISKTQGEKGSWDLYLYRLICPQKQVPHSGKVVHEDST